MKTSPWLFLLILIFTPRDPINSTPQGATQVGRKGCRIVDEVITKSGEVDYVDGVRVPEELGVLETLRRREKVSPCTCMLAFVATAARIRDVEDFRVMAGKMDYQEYHAYLYEDRYRDTATEILYGPRVNMNELRSGPHGQVPLPDGRAGEK